MKPAFAPRRLVNDWLLPVASGLLMMFSFPPWNSGQLAWASLLPLLFAVQSATVTQAFRRGYVAGLCFFAGTIWWIGHVTIGGTAMLIAFLALYFGGAASWFAWLFCRSRFEAGNANSDSVTRNMLLALAGAAGWVVLEWTRGWLLMGGFPWNMIGVNLSITFLSWWSSGRTGWYPFTLRPLKIRSALRGERTKVQKNTKRMNRTKGMTRMSGRLSLMRNRVSLTAGNF